MSPESTPDIGTRASRWRRWSVPLFLAGLLAIAGVGLARPLWRDSPEKKFDRDLTALREAIDRQPFHPQARERQMESLLQRVPSFPARAGEAHFLVGSAYVRLAEYSTPHEAEHYWRQAQVHLDRAEALGVPPKDRLRLEYRRGIAGYHLAEDPAYLIARLRPSVDQAADDSADALRILMQAYLNLPEPDFQAALEVNDKQLALPTIDSKGLARVQLMRGELLLRLERGEEARRTLERIRPGAPPDVLLRARYLRAESLQADAHWKEAAALWEELRGETEEDAYDRPRILYNLALCRRHLGQLGEAVQVWEETRRLGHPGGPERQAAALMLAEQRLRAGQVPLAQAAFEAAMQEIACAQDFTNPLLSLAEARRIFEEACITLREAGEFERSQQLALLYGRIAPAGRDLDLIAQAADAWALSLEEQCRRSSNPLEDTARLQAQWRRAGEAYEAAALADAAGRAERLWLSADRLQRARDFAAAAVVLQRYVQLPLPADKRGEAWYLLGETQRQAAEPAQAGAAYRRCLQFPGPFAYRARYQLALADIQDGKLEDAEATLHQNLSLMRQVPDEQAYENTLYTLAALLLRREKPRDAEPVFRRALERYPNHSQATRARYHLAQCCRQLADEEIKRFEGVGGRIDDHQALLRAQRREWLVKAAESYKLVADDLGERSIGKSLSAEDEAVLRHAVFAEAECRFQLGEYELAMRLNENLAVRFHHQVEGLMALMNVWLCYEAQLQPGKEPKVLLHLRRSARQTLQRLADALAETPDAAFDDQKAERTRKWWDAWVQDRLKRE